MLPGDNGALLRVRDTGVGIPEPELSRVFDRFHRIEGTRGRTYEGSGIGLALVQELVRLHGGTISVASAVGEGTVFTVSIPYGSAHLPADQLSAERGRASTATSAAAYVDEALRWLPGENAPEGNEPGGTVLDAPRTGGEDLGTALPPARRGGRVLFADDNADMRRAGSSSKWSG